MENFFGEGSYFVAFCLVSQSNFKITAAVMMISKALII